MHLTEDLKHNITETTMCNKQIQVNNLYREIDFLKAKQNYIVNLSEEFYRKVDIVEQFIEITKTGYKSEDYKNAKDSIKLLIKLDKHSSQQSDYAVINILNEEKRDILAINLVNPNRYLVVKNVEDRVYKNIQFLYDSYAKIGIGNYNLGIQNNYVEPTDIEITSSKSLTTEKINTTQQFQYAFKTFRKTKILIDGKRYQSGQILTAEQFKKANIKFSMNGGIAIALKRDPSWQKKYNDKRWSIVQSYCYKQ